MGESLEQWSYCARGENYKHHWMKSDDKEEVLNSVVIFTPDSAISIGADLWTVEAYPTKNWDQLEGDSKNEAEKFTSESMTDALRTVVTLILAEEGVNYDDK
jgi:hypothetical protein